MALAIILGALSGIVGFLPLYAGLRLTRKTTASGVAGSMTVLIIALVVSFAVLFALAFVCIAVARDMALAFVLAEVVALSIIAIVFGVHSVFTRKH